MMIDIQSKIMPSWLLSLLRKKTPKQNETNISILECFIIKISKKNDEKTLQVKTVKLHECSTESFKLFEGCKSYRNGKDHQVDIQNMLEKNLIQRNDKIVINFLYNRLDKNCERFFNSIEIEGLEITTESKEESQECTNHKKSGRTCNCLGHILEEIINRFKDYKKIYNNERKYIHEKPDLNYYLEKAMYLFQDEKGNVWQDVPKDIKKNMILVEKNQGKNYSFEWEGNGYPLYREKTSSLQKEEKNCIKKNLPKNSSEPHSNKYSKAEIQSKCDSEPSYSYSDVNYKSFNESEHYEKSEILSQNSININFSNQNNSNRNNINSNRSQQMYESKRNVYSGSKITFASDEKATFYSEGNNYDYLHEGKYFVSYYSNLRKSKFSEQIPPEGYYDVYDCITKNFKYRAYCKNGKICDDFVLKFKDNYLIWIGSFDEGKPVNCMYIQRKYEGEKLGPNIEFFGFYFEKDGKVQERQKFPDINGDFSKATIDQCFKQMRAEYAKIKNRTKVIVCDIGKDLLITNIGFFYFEDPSNYDGRKMPEFLLDDNEKKRYIYDEESLHEYMV